ncbi:hypothetical protein Tco_0172753 [Tanacetum coccineum]
MPQAVILLFPSLDHHTLASLVIDMPYLIDLNTPYGSSEGQYVVLSLQNTPYCLEERDTLFRLQKSIRCIWVESLIRRIQLVDTPYQPPSAATYCSRRKRGRHPEWPPLTSLSETPATISTVVPKRYSRRRPNLFLFILENTAVAAVQEFDE